MIRIPSYDAWDNAHRSGYMQSGFPARYDTYRPAPPPALLDLPCQFIQTPAPNLVVDLGSGTGLSTVVWTERARRVIGIEPLESMRRTAEGCYRFPHVSFRDAATEHTGIPDGAADAVTCAPSLHWMQPTSAFAEVARIPRPGGVFAAYDYDLVPTVSCEVEEAFAEFMTSVRHLRATHASRRGFRSGRSPAT